MTMREIMMHHGLSTGKNIIVHNERPDLDMVTIAANKAQALGESVQVIHTNRMTATSLKETVLGAKVLVLSVTENTHPDILPLITRIMLGKSTDGKHVASEVTSVVVVCDHTTDMTVALTLGSLAPCITIPIMNITSHIG